MWNSMKLTYYHRFEYLMWKQKNFRRNMNYSFDQVQTQIKIKLLFLLNTFQKLINFSQKCQ